MDGKDTTLVLFASFSKGTCMEIILFVRAPPTMRNATSLLFSDDVHVVRAEL